MQDKNIYNVGIIGNGFVGNAHYKLFSCSENNVKIYDKFQSNSEFSYLSSIEDVCKQEFIFVCVPTPMNKNGECNISIVESVLSDIKKYITKENLVIIKSSVPPGTTELFKNKFDLNLFFIPEFLTEKNAYNDLLLCSHIIVGFNKTSQLDPESLNEIDKENFLFLNKLKNLYDSIYKDGTYNFLTCHYTSAELVKYTRNCFLSLKVSYFNEIRKFCDFIFNDKFFNNDFLNNFNQQKLFDEVSLLSCLDYRITRSHSNVPGHDGKFGFGGSCFPKDVNAILFLAKDLGFDFKTLNAAWNVNLDVRPEKDWELLKNRAVSEL